MVIYHDVVVVVVDDDYDDDDDDDDDDGVLQLLFLQILSCISFSNSITIIIALSMTFYQ
jgi:hypothetical protein